MTAAPPPGTGLVRAWRSTWIPLTFLAVLVLGVVLGLVLFGTPPKSNDYLDPASGTSDGAKGLAQILVERGYHIDEVYSPARALTAVGSPGTGRTLIITSPDLLSAGQRRQLATAGADLVLVEPGSASLRVLAPFVHVVSQRDPILAGAEPSCPLAGARLAGPATAGGISYAASGPATGCYPVRGHPSLVRYSAAGRTLTIVGTGLPLSNGWLGEEGNAALALNLLSAHQQIVWLTPEPVVAGILPNRPGQRAPSLVPAIAWLVVLQLAVALGLAVIWRARRFGPLIAERLPVVVRASETVEGHARLYQASRSRDRAAATLRDAMLSRIKPLLGLPPEAQAEAVVGELSSRSARPDGDIKAIGYGPPPFTDLELVRLADDLDELEREVRAP